MPTVTWPPIPMQVKSRTTGMEALLPLHHLEEESSLEEGEEEEERRGGNATLPLLLLRLPAALRQVIEQDNTRGT